MADVLQGISPARIFRRPTADEVWPGPAQASALGRLKERPGTKVLTGPPSSGRSTVLRALPAVLGPRALLLATAGDETSAAGFLTSLLAQAGLAPAGLGEIDLRNLFSLFIQQRHAQGHRVVIAADDADRLHVSVWQELERLSMLSRQGKPVADLVLTVTEPVDDAKALTDFLTKLGTLSFCALDLLEPEQVRSYIGWRMNAAGLGDIFTPTAMHLIGRCTEGRFAAVDHLCQMALLMLRAEARSRVDVPLVIAATRELNERRRGIPSVPRRASRATAQPASPPLLVVSCEGQIIERCPLRQRLLIGRSEGNDLRLPNPFLSRHHAVIVETPQGYYITDLDSANGVVVNGEKVDASLLEDQDLVVLGPFRLKVELGDDTRAGADESLGDTSIMPAAPSPRHLRVIKRA